MNQETYAPNKSDQAFTSEGLSDIVRSDDKDANPPAERIGAFLIRTGNQWVEAAKKLPVPRKLFDVLWYEGEICILFASSNQGKSILAVQIADSISRRVPVVGFELDAEMQLVLYFDFEMSMKQFEARYSQEGMDHYTWHNNFQRCEIDPDAEAPVGFACPEDYLVTSIEEAIVRMGAKVVVIDNLTYLSTDTESAKGAAPLMKRLKELKARHDLSVLILAHTPKRDATKPLSQNDLQGSARLMQFCDSSFAIGASTQSSDIKYLKQIKVRNTALTFGEDNVIVCQIQKIDQFLQFVISGYSTEREHLKMKDENREIQVAQAREMTSQGMSQRAIAATMGLSVATINRLLKIQ